MARNSLRVSPCTQRKWKLASEVPLERPDLHPLHHYVDMKTPGHTGHVERMKSGTRKKTETTTGRNAGRTKDVRRAAQDTPPDGRRMHWSKRDE
jgi:hypothetical protein